VYTIRLIHKTTVEGLSTSYAFKGLSRTTMKAYQEP
jgi:hypothetical protein